VIKQLQSIAVAVFIAGGLLSGTLGLYRLGGLAPVESVAAPTPTPPPTPLAAPRSTPGLAQAPVTRLATATPAAKAPAAATPTPEPQDPNRPVWVYVVDGNIWITGGSAPAQLTNGGGLGQPALEDDRLVFVKRARNASEVWLASSEGPPRQITHDGRANSRARWSPDSKRIAYISDRGGSSQIWLMDPDGGNAKQVTNFATEADGVLFSPDGTNLVFSSLVFPECGADNACNQTKLNAESASKVRARIYTSLLYRHWVGWQSNRRSHLMVIGT